MEPDENPKSTESTEVPGGRGLLLPVGIFFAFIAASLCAGWYVHRGQLRADISETDRRYESMLQDLREQGEPVRFLDLVGPPVSGDQNGASLMLRAQSEYTACEEKPATEKAWSWYMDWEGDTADMKGSLKEFQSLLDCFAPAVALAEQALDRPEIRFDIDYGAGLETDITHFSDLIYFSDLFDLRARTRAAAGEGDAAVDDLVRLLQLSDTAEAGRVYIAAMIALSIRSGAVSCLKDVLRFCEPGPEALQRLGDRMDQTGKAMDPRDMLVSGRVYIIEVFRKLLAGKIPPNLQGSTSPDPPFVLKKTVIDLLERIQRCMDVAGRPYSEAAPVFRKACFPPGEGGIANALLEPIRFGFLAFAGCRLVLRMGSMACRIAAERPDGASGIPLFNDPFTGEPIRKREWAGAVLLSSPGPDRMDEGLEPADFTTKEPDGDWDDLYFYIPPPLDPRFPESDPGDEGTK